MMASKENSPDPVMKDEGEHKIDSHFIHYIRIAVAMAIIRTKPAGQTAQLYAEQLCVQHREAQLLWRSKAEKLKQEVLLLRQQLLERTWVQQGFIQPNKDLDTSGDDSQAYLTPPCSSEDPLDTHNAPSSQRDILKQHTSFLQSVLTLSTISTHKGLDTEGKSAKSVPIDSVFEQTVQESIESALITLGDLLTCTVSPVPVISQKMLFHMVQVLTNLVDNTSFSRYFSDVVCDRVLCFSWGIITALLTNTQLGEAACDRLCHMIVLLSRSPSRRPPIVRMLVTQLDQVSTHLRAVRSHHIQLNVPLFQSSYHILRALELILETDILRQDKCLTPAFCRDLHEQLDSSLLHIWECFQPFSQYVWHVQGLLQYLHTAGPETGSQALRT